MKTIRKAFDAVSSALGSQKYHNNRCYQKSVFCVETDCLNGRLLYQTLTGELLFLDESEALAWKQANDYLKDFMVAHWFLVPAGMDEIKLCNQMRRVTGLLHQDKTYINSFTVFTTTNCNARCFYCFERGQKRFSMTEQTARDAAKYMLSNANGEKIRIRWFGGEPLLNTEAIDIICEELLKHGAEYESTMVSNAYLFNEKTINRARQLWHLRHILITIDGTEDVYNRTKAYVYKEGSAYQIVMHNIQTILNAAIKVTVRLNMDAGNAADLFELADELGRRFYMFNNFNSNARLLIDYFGKIQAFESAEQALTTLQALNDRLERNGICEHNSLRTSIMCHSCMADTEHAVTILPDGRLGRCEHFGDSDEVGSIYGGWDKALVAEWKALRPVEDVCRTCSIYPQCFRLKKCNACPDKCNELFRGKQTMLLLDKIKNTYERYLKNNGGQNEILN